MNDFIMGRITMVVIGLSCLTVGLIAPKVMMEGLSAATDKYKENTKV